MLREYYQLAKPGIIYANVLTAAAGFLFAARGHVKPGLLLALLAGMALVIGGACAYNNYIDRGLDKIMARTKRRALVSGSISGRNALIFATLLSSAGLILLAFTVNRLTVAVAVVGLVDYVVLYGLAKRRTVHGTLVGCISGAVPIVAGYTAVSGRLDVSALLLFIILVTWQMPHFYAIALYRLEDYRAVHLPVMPAVVGAESTKLQIMIYIGLFIAACAGLTVWGHAGYVYLAVMTAIGLSWLLKGLRSYRSAAVPAWGKSMFLFSLIVIMGLSVMLAVGPLLV